MNRRELRAVGRAVLHELGLTRPLDVSLLCDCLADKRGRPIELVPTDALPHNSAFGFTGGDDTVDVIMYEKRTARAHQTLIILHELAHMILEHPRHAVDHGYSSAQAEEFHTITPEALAEVLGQQPSRSTSWLGKRRMKRGHPSLYDDRNEWEAEVLATILFSWTSACATADRAPTTDRLETILGAGTW
jgi:hypothetical protein